MEDAEFPADVRAAIALQRRLAGRVFQAPRPRRIKAVAGIDVAYDGASGACVAALVTLAYPSLALLDMSFATKKVSFPYIPGLLSFRETPVCYELVRQRRDRIDVLLIDGHGRAHPRRFGLASHLGVLLDLPTIGVAKSRLVGADPRRLGRSRGARAPLYDGRERVGTVLRTKAGVKPVYVSIGHRARLAWAETLVLAMAPNYRIPEPLRRAHLMVTLARKYLSRHPGATELGCDDRRQYAR